MTDVLEDVSLVWLVALSAVLTVVSYLLLTNLRDVSGWIVWGGLMLVVALAAAAVVLFREEGTEPTD